MRSIGQMSAGIHEDASCCRYVDINLRGAGRFSCSCAYQARRLRSLQWSRQCFSDMRCELDVTFFWTNGVELGPETNKRTIYGSQMSAAQQGANRLFSTSNSLSYIIKMCDFTHVRYRCCHTRYTVRAWCMIYQESHIRCPLNVIAM